jgi:uncharacterized protein (DUF952 family)
MNLTLIKTAKTGTVKPTMKDRVYKIFRQAEWKAFQQEGHFRGSKDDLRDGFIHLSTKNQVEGVIDRFFSGVCPLYVAEFSEPQLLKQLKWEGSGASEFYPHLYGSDLQLADMAGFEKL